MCLEDLLISLRCCHPWSLSVAPPLTGTPTPLVSRPLTSGCACRVRSYGAAAGQGAVDDDALATASPWLSSGCRRCRRASSSSSRGSPGPAGLTTGSVSGIGTLSTPAGSFTDTPAWPLTHPSAPLTSEDRLRQDDRRLQVWGRSPAVPHSGAAWPSKAPLVQASDRDDWRGHRSDPE